MVKINNLHISMTPFTHESRVLKEVNTISVYTDIDKIYIAGLHENELLPNEKISDQISLKRFILKTRNLPKNIPFQLIKYVEFVFKIYYFYRQKQIKVINIHTLALLPLGFFLKYSFGAKLIYDTHELETETLNLRGVRKILSKLAEKALINYCDHVICVNESISKWYNNEYKMKNKPIVLLNTPEFKGLIKKNDLFRKIFKIPREKKICIFQGNLAKGRSIEEIVSAFKNYDLSDYCIVFLGNGPLAKWLENESKISSNIFYHQAVNRSILLDFTSSADIGLNFTDYNCLNHVYSLPNKFFEYASASLTILCSNNVEFKQFINKYKCGKCITEITPKNIYDCLITLSDKDCDKYSQNALKMFESNCWEKQELKLVALYKELLL